MERKQKNSKIIFKLLTNLFVVVLMAACATGARKHQGPDYVEHKKAKSRSFEAQLVENPEAYFLKKNWAKSTLKNWDNSFRPLSQMQTVLNSDFLVQGNAMDSLLVLNNKTLNPIWHKSIPGGVEGGAELINQRLFFGGNDSNFYSVDLTSGDTLWKFPAQYEVFTKPSLDDGVVYFTNGASVVYALDAASGQKRWFYSRVETQILTIRGASRPLAHQGVVYVGFNDGALVALDARDGKLIWEKSFNKQKQFRDLDTEILAKGDYLYFLGFDDAIYCVDKSNGNLVWSNEPGGYGKILLYQDHIFYAASNSHLYKLDAKSGKLIWRSEKKAKGIFSSPELYSEKIFVSSDSQGELALFAMDTGKELLSLDTGTGVFTPIKVLDDTKEMLFVSLEGNLYSVSVEEKNSFMPWLNR